MFNRAYVKLAKQALLAFPLVYLLFVVVLHSDSGSSGTAADFRISVQEDTHGVFKEKDDIEVLVDEFKPIGGAMDNELSFKTYDYYDPHFQFERIAPKETDPTKLYRHTSFSSLFMANSSLLRKPLYQLQFGRRVGLHIFKELEYTPEQSQFINTLIRKGYGHTVYVDSDPASVAISADEVGTFNNKHLFSQNIPLGFVDKYGRAIIYNHYVFDMFYRKVANNKFKLLYSTVHPMSMYEPHVFEDIFEVRDLKALSETQPSKLSWTYNVNWHETRDPKVKAFVPKVPLATPALSKYFKKYMSNCVLALFTPLLAYLLSWRYGKNTAGSQSTLIAYIPPLLGACAMATSASLLFVFMAFAFHTEGVAFIVISVALASPVLGVVSLYSERRLIADSGLRPSPTLTSLVSAVAGVALFFAFNFVTLQAITKKVKLSQIIFFIAGLALLVITPGSLLGHKLAKERLADLAGTEPEHELQDLSSSGSPRESAETTAETSEVSSTASRVSDSFVKRPFVLSTEPLLNPLQEFTVVSLLLFVCSVPLYYPSSEMFFFVAYSRQFHVDQFLERVLFGTAQFLATYFLASHILLQKISCQRYVAYTVVALIIADAAGWAHFLKGFKVANTTGGGLFVQKSLVKFYRAFDAYDSGYLLYFLGNMIVAHGVIALAAIGLSLCT